MPSGKTAQSLFISVKRQLPRLPQVLFCCVLSAVGLWGQVNRGSRALGCSGVVFFGGGGQGGPFLLLLQRHQLVPVNTWPRVPPASAAPTHTSAHTHASATRMGAVMAHCCAVATAATTAALACVGATGAVGREGAVVWPAVVGVELTGSHPSPFTTPPHTLAC